MPGTDEDGKAKVPAQQPLPSTEKLVPSWGCGQLHKPVILALEMLRQKDQTFKASPSYIKEASLGYTRLCFKKTKPNNHSVGL